MNATDAKVTVLFDAATVGQLLAGMAREIAAANGDGRGVVLVAIQTGGVHLAQLLAAELGRLWPTLPPIGHVDISMHRDDLGDRLAPEVHPTEIPFDIAGKTVILVDDVFSSGRTARAAMDALNDFGRPRRIQLAVLVDRDQRELPIRADFVGRTVATNTDDRIEVHVTEAGHAKVILEKAGG